MDPRSDRHRGRRGRPGDPAPRGVCGTVLAYGRRRRGRLSRSPTERIRLAGRATAFGCRIIGRRTARGEETVMAPNRQKWLTLVAVLGLAYWFFGNLYEAIVFSPNWVTDTPAQMTRLN